jgi:hypothetical protein
LTQVNETAAESRILTFEGERKAEKKNRDQGRLISCPAGG